MESTMAWVMAALGIVAFLLIEGFKLYTRVSGTDLSSKAKLWTSLAVCLVVAIAGGLVTGELDFSLMLAGFKLLPEDPMAAVLAVFDLIMQMLKLIGLLLAVASAMYAALKDRMKEARVLSFKRLV